MRFITEFENTPALLLDEGYNSWVKTYETRGQLDIATQIGNSFGWETDEQPFKIRHTLEIEAFPMEKWIEFKNRLFVLIETYPGDVVGALTIIKELESFGKPAGEEGFPNNPPVEQTGTNIYFDATKGKVYSQRPDGPIEDITSPQEYRGPNSHCKACEEERAGIKHITAQKHTCKK